MNFLRRLCLMFYATFVMYIGVFWIALGTGYLKPHDYINTLQFVFTDENLTYLVTLFAIFIVVINYIPFRILSANVRRDKIISFDNPSGKVSVSLFALEDLVKRLLLQFIEIKEVKPKIRSGKKGLHVKIPLVLKSDINIPEVTSRVQAEVLKKIKDTIGADEQIVVAVYVGKIHPEKFKERIDKSQNASVPPPSPKDEGDQDGPMIPYQGYKA